MASSSDPACFFSGTVPQMESKLRRGLPWCGSGPSDESSQLWTHVETSKQQGEQWAYGLRCDVRRAPVLQRGASHKGVKNEVAAGIAGRAPDKGGATEAHQGPWGCGLQEGESMRRRSESKCILPNTGSMKGASCGLEEAITQEVRTTHPCGHLRKDNPNVLASRRSRSVDLPFDQFVCQVPHRAVPALFSAQAGHHARSQRFDRPARRRTYSLVDNGQRSRERRCRSRAKIGICAEGA